MDTKYESKLLQQSQTLGFPNAIESNILLVKQKENIYFNIRYITNKY